MDLTLRGVSSGEQTGTSGAQTVVFSDNTKIGLLSGLRWAHAGAAVRYLHLHDASSAPSDGATPKARFVLPATDNGVVRLDRPIGFNTGLTWVVSTTFATTTKDASASIGVECIRGY